MKYSNKKIPKIIFKKHLLLLKTVLHRFLYNSIHWKPSDKQWFHHPGCIKQSYIKILFFYKMIFFSQKKNQPQRQSARRLIPMTTDYLDKLLSRFYNQTTWHENVLVHTLSNLNSLILSWIQHSTAPTDTMTGGRSFSQGSFIFVRYESTLDATFISLIRVNNKPFTSSSFFRKIQN